MDLSKAYDCLPHDLIIANQQTPKGENCLHYRLPTKVLVRVPQGSVLGLLLFNIFINDIFLYDMSFEICNFADDNAISACRNDMHEIVMVLGDDL